MCVIRALSVHLLCVPYPCVTLVCKIPLLARALCQARATIGYLVYKRYPCLIRACVNRVLSDHCVLSVRYPCVIRALCVCYSCLNRALSVRRQMTKLPYLLYVYLIAKKMAKTQFDLAQFTLPKMNRRQPLQCI